MVESLASFSSLLPSSAATQGSVEMTSRSISTSSAECNLGRVPTAEASRYALRAESHFYKRELTFTPVQGTAPFCDYVSSHYMPVLCLPHHS